MTDKSLKKVRFRLSAEIYSVLLLCLITVVLFENEVLLPGGWADQPSRQFVFQSVMEVVCVAVIPLALYLFKIKKVDRDLRSRQYSALASWGTLRMMLIGLPMLCNTILYYLFMSVAFGYMAIILLLCTLFIFPSEERCRQEAYAKTDEKA